MSGTEYAGWLSSNPPRGGGSGLPAALGRGILATVTVPIGLVGGLGWCYAMRQQGWFGAGPKVNDSLPLLQLAQFDAQPLLRVVVAWLVSGLVAGLLLMRMRRVTRAALTAGLGAALLALDSQASYALTRNLRFSTVLWSHAPGLGVWLGAALFALAATAVPHR